MPPLARCQLQVWWLLCVHKLKGGHQARCMDFCGVWIDPPFLWVCGSSQPACKQLAGVGQAARTGREKAKCGDEDEQCSNKQH